MLSASGRRLGRHTSVLPLLALGLCVTDAVSTGPPWALALALVLLALSRRRARPVLWVPAVGVLLVAAGARLHLRIEERHWAARSSRRLEEQLGRLEQRKQELVAELQDAAFRVAALPETARALAGDRAALAALFAALQSLREGSLERTALAVHVTSPPTTIAWSGSTLDPAVFEGLVGRGPDVFVVEGNVSTTLVAEVPVAAAAEAARGFVTATVPVAVRRNISNEFLRDFDLIMASDPGVELHYVDARDEPRSPEPFPPLDPALLAREAVLRAPGDGVLAAARVTAPSLPEVRRQLRRLYDRVLSLLLAAALVGWASTSREAGRAWARWLLAGTGLRAALMFLPPPLPGPASSLLSPDVYASTLLGPLLRSPLDFLLTALWLGLLACAALAAALRRPRGSSDVPFALVAPPAMAAIAGVFLLMSDAVANSALELPAVPLLPRSVPHLVMQSALLVVLAAGAAAATALLCLAGPFRPSRWHATFRLLALTLLTAGLDRAWPTASSDLPFWPALALTLSAGVAAGTRDRWRSRLEAARPGVQAGLSVALVAALAVVLYPTLVHLAEASTRGQIAHDHAAAVLRQPQWRAFVLEETERRIDAMRVLEEAPAGPRPPGVEELAFAVWSATGLATFSFSSAVEIQDPSGAVISRFALNLASLAGEAERPLPSSEVWEQSAETARLASETFGILHARRRLVYHGELHGAIHLYVKEDFWNLPFVRARDPYSVLFRTASRGTARERPVALVSYRDGGDIAFTSVDRPPGLDAALVAAVRGGAPRWTTLDLDGRPHRAYVFAGPSAVHVLAYPLLTPQRYAADLIEAAAAFGLLAIVALLVVLAVRTALGRGTLSLRSLAHAVQRRFVLRLFVAFILLAFVPVAVLQVLVRNFLEDRLRTEFAAQALERAVIAKKGVEDYAFFNAETGGGQAVTDQALVWLASVIRNDLDLFDRGRLLASSKRELYASGLLSSRVSGEVYRALVVEGQPSVLRPERIGDFSYIVASVPLRIGRAEPGVLSVPLALRQREVQVAVEDLDRSMRLAAVGFMLLAAALAQSVARRISGPISALTRATRRVAQGDLAARVEPTTRDELRRLVESFNQMARDLDRQRADLERSNRLAAWAEMARQVAHEVKNPLTPIQLSAEHLRRVYRDSPLDVGPTLEACTQAILKQVRTLRGLVTEFSAFARPPAAVLETQDPAAVLREVMRPYQAGLPPDVRLEFEADPGVPKIQADRRLLERAVVNLLENALQAVGESGRITVRLRRSDGGRVQIEVEDTGAGVEPEIRERVFEPFFSTKTTGSGLGLALVKKIAEDHGGGVSLEDAPGGGTRAVLWLPVQAQGDVA